MEDKCKECGCICKKCNKIDQKHNDIHLHVEIENLRQRLVERDNHIVMMETQFLNEAKKFPNGELASLKEEIIIWQDKYTRLYESHKRIQKINQNLEDKLLKIVDKCETEKGVFTKDIAALSHKLADANHIIHQLTQDNEKYRNDVNLAIQLLQCKPSNFIGQKYELLPPEVQTKVRTYITQKSQINEIQNTDIKSITVPISTFPPTAMVYNIAKPTTEKQVVNTDDGISPPIDMVSTAIMAKILEERGKERIFVRHCNTCICYRSVLKVDNESQTVPEQDEIKILRANDYFKVLLSHELSNTQNKEEISLKSGNEQSHHNDLNINDIYSVSELAISKPNTYKKNFKIFYQNNSQENSCFNLSNNKNIVNEFDNKNTLKLMNGVDEVKLQSNYLNSESKSMKGLQIFDNQAKIDMINERLWKNKWINSKNFQSNKESQVQLDVINDRIWKNNNKEKLPPLTIIEVQNSNDFTNENKKMQTEPIVNQSFSCNSIIISAPDTSSLSNVFLNQSQSNSTQEQINGPRNCLMRVNNNAYQTVLYTSGCSRPSTALVHIARSLRSGRSVPINSEKNMRDNSHIQRLAQWVDSFSSGYHSHNIEALDIALQHSLSNVNYKSIEPEKLQSNQAKEKPDLISFEGSNDVDNKFPTTYQDTLTEEIKETYKKLAANFDPMNLQLIQSDDNNIMTSEKYRKQQKYFYRSTQTKFHSRT